MVRKPAGRGQQAEEEEEEEEDEDGAGDSGTMVKHPTGKGLGSKYTGTMVAAKGQSQSTSSSSSSSEHKQSHEPSYMQHMRASASQPPITQPQSNPNATIRPTKQPQPPQLPPHNKPTFNPNTATMIHGTPTAATLHTATSQSQSQQQQSAGYGGWYREGKRLDVVGLSGGSSMAELNGALNGLSRAYEEERGEMDRTYEETRQRIRQWIATKPRG